MIKFKFIGSKNHNQFYAIKKNEAELEKLGISVSDKDPDFLLLHTDKVNHEALEEKLSLGIPCIILERIDSSNILCPTLLKNPNLLAIVKDSVFRDWKLEKEPKFEGRYHGYLIAKDFQLHQKYPQDLRTPPTDLMNESDLNKVKLWYNYETYPMMRGIISQDIDFSKNRPTDVSFLGTISYGRRSIDMHRKTCINEIRKLKNRRSLVSERKERYAMFLDSLLNSKIVISPWGLGEKCYRDYEAIFAGAVIIKPNSEFIKDRIDLYDPKNNYYIPCKSNFSDLAEKVDLILSTWNQLKDQRIENRRRLIDSIQPQTISLYIKNLIENCVKGKI